MSVKIQDQEDIAIFWDCESARPISAISSYDIVHNIRSAVLPFGPIKSFRAYWNFSQGSPRSANVRSELSSSGVTLVDCPDDGRKGLGVKIMLVDMIAYAWDHGVPRTFVVITGDRDLAYAVSVLRMRNFRVVVMSPAGTHSDLGAQASAQLDWSKLVLGFHDGVPETTIFPDGPPAPPNPPSAYTQQQPRATTDTPFSSNFRKTGLNGSAQKQAESAFEPELVELRDIPARARRNSVFSSYDPRKFDVFADFGDVFMTPKTQRGSFGLGDGPLFPRPKSRGEEQSSRTDSAPPNMTHFANLPKPTYPHFHETATGVNQSWKGKTRPIIEPESIEPQAPIASSTTMPNSDSVFEPFGETRPPFQTISTLAQPESKTLSTRGSSVSSSPSSRSTSFSIVQHPNASTAPTSAEPLAANADKAVAPAQQASPKAPTIVPSRRSSDTETPALKKTVDVATSKVASEAPQKSEMKPIQTQPPPVVRPSSAASVSKPVVAVQDKPVASTSTSAPSTSGSQARVLPGAAAGSSTRVPLTGSAARFQVLVDVLRNDQHKFPKGVPKSTLGASLLKHNGEVYRIAGVKKFGQYIAEAVQAGIVQESQQGESVVLRPQYAVSL